MRVFPSVSSLESALIILLGYQDSQDFRACRLHRAYRIPLMMTWVNPQRTLLRMHFHGELPRFQACSVAFTVSVADFVFSRASIMSLSFSHLDMQPYYDCDLGCHSHMAAVTNTNPEDDRWSKLRLSPMSLRRRVITSI